MNSYVPYRTSITSGDITRIPYDDTLVIGRLVNFMRRLYAITTGYTQQNYNQSNTVTPQTNALTGLNNEVNKLTPPTLDFSSKPRGALK